MIVVVRVPRGAASPEILKVPGLRYTVLNSRRSLQNLLAVKDNVVPVGSLPTSLLSLSGVVTNGTKGHSQP